MKVRLTITVLYVHWFRPCVWLQVVDHLWMYDGMSVLMVTRQGRFSCLDIHKSKQVGRGGRAEARLPSLLCVPDSAAVAACLPVSSACLAVQRYKEHILGVDGSQPCVLAAMGRQAFAVMGEKVGHDPPGSQMKRLMVAGKWQVDQSCASWPPWAGRPSPSWARR